MNQKRALINWGILVLLLVLYVSFILWPKIQELKITSGKLKGLEMLLVEKQSGVSLDHLKISAQRAGLALNNLKPESGLKKAELNLEGTYNDLLGFLKNSNRKRLAVERIKIVSGGDCPNLEISLWVKLPR